MVAPSLARPLIAAVVIAIVALAPSPGAPGFELAIPMVAGQTGTLGTDGPGSTPSLPLKVSAGLSFGEFAPGGGPVSATFTATNEGALPLRLKVSASSLAGPEGAAIGAAYLALVTPSATGLLAGPVDAGTLAPGASGTYRVVLTPPNGDVQYLPSGAYYGTIKVHAEVAA